MNHLGHSYIQGQNEQRAYFNFTEIINTKVKTFSSANLTYFSKTPKLLPNIVSITYGDLFFSTYSKRSNNIRGYNKVRFRLPCSEFKIKVESRSILLYQMDSSGDNQGADNALFGPGLTVIKASANSIRSGYYFKIGRGYYCGRGSKQVGVRYSFY